MLFKKSFGTIFSFKKPSTISSQLVRFGVSGGFTAGIDFLLLVFLVEVFFLHYLVAGGISFTVGVCLNYWLSRRWVFHGGKYRHSIEFLGFFTTSTIGLALNQIILWILVDSISINYRISKTIAIFAVTFWNFITKRYLIFKS
jgi:putative flippase GtrA